MENKKFLESVQEGDLVKILDKDKALELNPNENITTSFWESFSGKIVEIKMIVEDFFICFDDEKQFQVFPCDIEKVFVKTQVLAKGGH